MTADSLIQRERAGSDDVAPTVRRGGRPSRAAAQQLGNTILDAATALFLADGYDLTSIETIAAQAGISKRTFYHRYKDKAAVFRAVVHRLLEGLRNDAGPALFEGADLEQVMRRVAKLMLQASVTPAMLALHRLIVAEAARFPELAVAVADEGAEATKEITALLDRGRTSGALSLEDVNFAAAALVQLVIAVPQRRALGLGIPMTRAELDAWAEAAVGLFLDGSRAR